MPSLAQRFEASVFPEPMSGCWLWDGAVNGLYGRIYGKGRDQYAHRVAYELYRGPIPAGAQIDHLCKTPLCVNPAHLEAVSHYENLRRSSAWKVNVEKKTCPKGHEYTGDNLYVSKTGGRNCKQCRREYQSAYLRRKHV